MQYRADALGLVGQVTTIFRELVHERLGLFYEAAQFDQVADRLAPLVVERGLASFMDYYYLLKYSDDEAEWGRVMDALSVPETYFWRESDQLRAMVGDRRPRAHRRASRTPAADLERPVRERRRAADAGDDARGGPMVRPGADPDPRKRRQPGRRGQGRTGPVRAARVPEPVAGSPREVLHAGWGPLDRRSRASPACRLRRREPGRAGRGGAARVRADRLLPQRVHLLFRAEHPADARRDDAAHARPGVPLRRRIGIAAAPAHGVRASRKSAGRSCTSRGSTPRNDCRHPSRRSGTKGSEWTACFVCSSWTIRRTSGKSSRKCSRIRRRWRSSARHRTATKR